MNIFRLSAPLGVLLTCFALNAMAQAATTAEPKKDEPKKTQPKKADPKKAAPKKATDPAKADPKKAPAKKADEKTTKTSQGGTITTYQAGKAPPLKDSKGNSIPTNPEEYDVSSATTPAKKKK